MVVLEGRPTLRTPDGRRELEPGETVSFKRGETGAHQLVNRTAERVRFLSISTNGDPDLVIYPDSQKLGAAERLPTGGGFRKYFRLESEVDYYDREAPPAAS